MRVDVVRRRRCAAALFVAALFVAALVPGCSSIPPSDAVVPTGANTIDGRIAIHYKDAASGKEDALSGRFAWIESSDGIELNLLDPLGQTVARIRTGRDHASITFRDGRVVEGATPEALTRQTLGYTVPLRGLTSWLAGRTAEGSPVDTLTDGRLRQDGWSLRFSGADAATKQLPRRIDLYYPGPPAEIEIRLVVDQRSAG